MIASIEKPGTPQELVHFGVKGMKWGVRKQRSSSSPPRKKMSKKKKVAIGVGIGIAVAGTAFVAYKLHRDGNLRISDLRRKKASNGVVYKNVEEAVLAKKGQVPVSQIVARHNDRERYLQLLMNSSKYKPTYEEALALVDEVYPRLS